MSKQVAKEIGEAIATAVCGHGPEELSPQAKKVYQQMTDCGFRFNAMVGGVLYPFREKRKGQS